MYEVIVLKEGYTKPVSKGLVHAGGSVTLLKGPQNIVVDTGSPWDRDLLLKGLESHGVPPDKVNYVICTHGHSDHGIPYEIDDFVEIWPTPGHTGADVSVIVRGTKQGVVAVTGDLFECQEDLEDPELWQRDSEQPQLQEQSRIDVLRVADHIVPGHGPMFPVPPEYRQQMRVVMMREEHVVEYSYTSKGGRRGSNAEAVSETSSSSCIIVETD